MATAEAVQHAIEHSDHDLLTRRLLGYIAHHLAGLDIDPIPLAHDIVLQTFAEVCDGVHDDSFDSRAGLFVLLCNVASRKAATVQNKPKQGASYGAF